jgi:hypothetical protein
MPSRWGPGVLPEPNYNFANALAGLQSGYGFGSDILAQRRQRQREQEEWQEHEEDRNRYLTQLRAGEEAQPGAMPLASFLQDPAYKKEVDVAATKAQPASAGGRLVFAPHFARDLYQEPTSGAVVSRGAAREQLLGDYLGRQMPIWQARGQIEQGKEDAALKRVMLQQSGAAARTAAQQAGATSRAGMPARPRAAAGGTGRAGAGAARIDPRVAALAAHARLTQQRRQAIEASPAAAEKDPGHAQWLIDIAAARTADDSAQARYNRMLQVAAPAPGGAPAPIGAAGGWGHPSAAAAPRTAQPAAPAKSPQDWVDEVAAEPGWASKPDSLIIREARRREAASRGPR